MPGSRSNRIAEIGELQLAVLDILKDLGEGTVYDVLDRFPDGEKPRYNTVMTVLRTLEKKGLATHRKQERAFVFQPTEEADGVRRRVVRDVVDRGFGGSPTRLMATLLKEGDVSAEALADLKELLEREGEEDDS